MARLPKDAAEAAAEFGVEKGSTVVAVGPAEGYVEALAEVVGTQGKIVVHHPPPGFKSRKKAVQVVDAVPNDLSAQVVIAWVPVVSLKDVRALTSRVSDEGSLWLVVPRGDRNMPAPVTEGDVKRSLLPLGWRETRVVGLSTDALAMRFHRRR